MKRLLLVALVALVATGAASADTFTVVPDPTVATTPSTLPSAATPNVGDVLLPQLLFAPAAPVQLGWDQLLPIWQGAGQAYGVPWSVLASINKIESNFGTNMGPSSAGAIGWMQFMPDTWSRWGIDANGDGVADPWNPQDAIYSAARYLAAAGGATDIASAVFSYNHAQWYVDEVLQLAQQYDGGGTDYAAAIEAAQKSVDDAKQVVIDANTQMLAARDTLDTLQKREQDMLAAANNETLLTDRLAAQENAARTDLDVQAAQADLDARQVELQNAEDALTVARDQASGAAFAPGAGTLLGAPSFSGGYVFPVAGGPGVVSVGHTHHDYPAADIAAPEGTQLYDLHDGVVTDAWPTGNGNCGIGFTLAATDGLTWTYCHLSYLEPAVIAGAQLTAGAPVGFVGQTGHASGPHLHLQLQPATAYPQEEPWFQAFAGTAFSWSDSVQTNAAQAPVFAVVGDQQQSARLLDSASTGTVFFTASGA